MCAREIRLLSSVPAEPWRNGGGITRTLATNGTEWRVSVAEVERDGPYSRFDGITRISFVLRGQGVRLSHAASVVRLDPFKAAEYDGGIEWDARLVDGPVTVLNIMSAAGRYRTKVDAIVDTTIVPPGCAAIVIAFDSGCKYSGPGIACAGTIEPGQMMVMNGNERPLRLLPELPTLAAGHETPPPVLLTIEPATI